VEEEDGMQTSDTLNHALNVQVGNEMGASLQYISIAAHFDAQSLTGLARFFFRQAEEEREHAMKFVHYVIDSGGQLEIPAIAAPQASFGSAREAVGLALEREKEVTRQIYGLVDIAKEDSNYIAIRFLDWFVNEQFEEVTSMGEMLDVVKRAGEENLLAVEEFLAREGKVPEALTENER
jgi:ferritin